MAKPAQQEIISRHSLMWLLIVNLAVLLPLYDKFTPWTMAICGICLLWRYGIFIGKVAKPPKLLVSALALGSALTLALVTTKIGVLNALINLLILGYALKYIEMTNRRDVRVVVLVGYFLIGITLIGQQSIYYSVLLTIIAAINTCVLVSLYREDVKLFHTAKVGFLLIIQSLPLAILLFIVFPRLQPLWLVPQLKTGQTGISDEVSFGEIERLTRSAALAFRVNFTGKPPANHLLYWRALVLEDYDGDKWTQSGAIKRLEEHNQSSSTIQPQGTSIDYTVIAERSYQHWLFGLDVATSDATSIIQLPDFRLYSTKNLTQKFQYKVKSYPGIQMDKFLTPASRDRNLFIPEDTNPKTQALASEYKSRFPKPEDRLNTIMNAFAAQNYFYTLTPPAVGPHQIDDFLLENKAGFCVHYASALVFLARASGIPARMVTGYQGGEWNNKAKYLSVYQYMAHAWTEVWLDGKGWIRLDPTAMIAPERVLEGFDAYFQGQDSYLIDSPFSTLRLRDFPLLNELRLTLASVDFYWNIWVLGFDADKQEKVLQKLLGKITTQKLAIFMLICILLIILAIAMSAGLIHFSRGKDKISTAYFTVCSQLAKQGMIRDTHQGPQDFCEQVINAYPNIEKEFSRFTQYYIALKYQPLSERNRKRITRLFLNQSKQLSKRVVRGKFAHSNDIKSVIK